MILELVFQDPGAVPNNYGTLNSSLPGVKFRFMLVDLT